METLTPRDQRVLSAIAHPLRIQIIAILATGKASPKDIAEQLDGGASLGVVSYHVRRLHGLGVIRLVGEERRRGAVEHYYRAKQPLARLALEVVAAVKGNGAVAGGSR